MLPKMPDRISLTERARDKVTSRIVAIMVATVLTRKLKGQKIKGEEQRLGIDLEKNSTQLRRSKVMWSSVSAFAKTRPSRVS